MLRQGHRGHGRQCGGVGNESCQGGGGGSFRGDQVDLGILGAAAAQEVPVEGTQAHAAGVGREAHTDTGAAGTFQHPGTAGKDVSQGPAVCQHGQHLPGTGRDGKAHIGSHRLALENGRHLQHIRKGGVGTRTDTHLIHRHIPEALHRNHIVRAVGTGNHGLEGRKVNVNHPVILCIRVAGQGYIVFLSSLGCQEFPGLLVGGENGGGCPQLCTHVGDGSPLRNGKGHGTGAAPLHNDAHAALYGQNPQQLQAHILGADPGPEGTGQVYLVKLGHGDIVGTAAHGHCHIHAAGAKGQHAQAAAGGGVAVGADEGLARLAEPLQVHLMADTIAGTGEPDAVLGCHRLQIPVVVRIFKAALQGVVVHIGHAQLSFYLGNPHGFKFQIGHGAGGILGQGLVNPQGNLLTGFHNAVYQVGLDDFLCNGHCHITLTSQSCFLWHF